MALQDTHFHMSSVVLLGAHRLQNVHWTSEFRAAKDGGMSNVKPRKRQPF